MTKKAPTIKDVAERAGVSVATVSRTMNNKGYLSDEVKQKVNQAMKELNYVPNLLARSFNTKRSNVIGAIIPTIENPYFAELVYHIEKAAEAQGFKLLLCNSLNDTAMEQNYLQMLIANQVDGIIVGTHNDEIDEYKIPNMPIVAIERYLNDQHIPTICCDNYQGGKLATEYLIQQNCQHIVCLTGLPRVNFPAYARRVAFQEVMTQHQRDVIFVEVEGLDPNTRQRQIQEQLERYPNIDGIFATDDVFALLAEQAIRKSTILQSDIQIIGFDGTNLMRSLYPDLPTIKQNIERMAQLAVTTLLLLIDNEQVDSLQTVPIELYLP